MSREFPRDSRITRGPDLQRVLKEGKRIRTRFFDVRICASPLGRQGPSRVGIIVPKAKHTGVERNRLKRRLRELSRTMILTEHSSTEVVLLARADSYDASFADLLEGVRRIADELRASVADTR